MDNPSEIVAPLAGFAKNVTKFYEAITATDMAPPVIEPTGLQVDIAESPTKLYEAITSSNWEEVIQLAESNPDEAKTWVVRYFEDQEGVEKGDDEKEKEIMWRILPIHSACARQPPIEVITALLKAYPEGAKCVDDQGMFALHYACGNQASKEVVRSLLMSFPDAAKMKDPRGMLAIHYLACWGPSSIAVVDMILVANSNVAYAKDEDGNTALDLAMEGEYAEKHNVIAALKRWFGIKSEPVVDVEEKKEDGPALELSNDPMKKLEHRVAELSAEVMDGRRKLFALEKSLLDATGERDGLRKTLADLTERHGTIKTKAVMMDERLGSLQTSLQTMMEQQKIVLDALKARDEKSLAHTHFRREKLRELVEMEDVQTADEDGLTECFLRQAKEMESISSIIAQVRL